MPRRIATIILPLALTAMGAARAGAQQPGAGGQAVSQNASAAGSLGFTYGASERRYVEPGREVRRTVYPRVLSVVPRSSAVEAGIRVGDVVLAVNGRDGLGTALFPDRSAGALYVVRVRRGDDEREITFRLPQSK